MVKITINEVEIEVPEGELIVESVKRRGLEIPVFCYHPRMKPVGMCRMCIVEVGFKQADGSVRMMPKPQAGCTLPASEGMVVFTDSQNVHKDRRGVLEFLLINHPLDCPICDRGGECPLQNNTLAYGPSTTRFIELKRHLPKAFPLSKYVTLDLERCIQCGRCVRFTEEISGEHELAFRFRGASMQPSTFQLLDFESKFSGNVIEICPVGALTSAKYRFRARPWDLETSPAVCTQCSNGCNVWFDHRAGKFVRISGRTNEEVNEEWTCDKGKFGHDYINAKNRLTTPLIRQGDRFVEASWSEAYEAIVKGFDRPGNEVAGLSGPRVANEGLYLFQKMFRTVFNSGNVDSRWTKNLVAPSPRGSIAGLEGKTSLLVLGTDLASDLPIVFLRVRKAATQHGVRVVSVSATSNEMDQFADTIARCRPGSEADFASALVTGSREVAESKCDIPEATFQRALGALGTNSAVIVSDLSLDVLGTKAASELKQWCESKGIDLNVYATGANSTGAHLLGVSAEGQGTGTWATIQGLSSGSIKSLWLTECDLATMPGGQSALENAEFVVYQGTCENETMAFASVVLPMAAPAEQDGTWTNCEGRVQRMVRAIAAPGESKPAWRIFAELILRLEATSPYFNPGEVMAEIAKTVPVFAGVALDTLPEEGILLNLDGQEALAGTTA